VSGADLAALAAIFGQLSLLAFGGGNSILPEMQRQVVEVHPWMSAVQFAALYALAQAAPGPNMLVVTLIGWRVAGLPGALVATLALCVPSSALTYGVAGLWYRFRHAPWRALVQRALLPVTAGLVLAGAALLTESTTTGWKTGLLTLGATGLFLGTRLNPLWVLGAGALIGALCL
jgi:chromate transporter